VTLPPRDPRPGPSSRRSAARPAAGTARPRSGPSRPAGTAVAAHRRRPVRLGHQGVRLRAGLLMVLVMLSLIAGRLVWLQGFQATAYAGQAVEQRLRTTNLLAPRGTITDRNGQVLALSVDARAVYAEPRTIARATCRPDAERPCDPEGIAEVLAPALGLPVKEVRTKLSRPTISTGTCTTEDPMTCSGFVYLARGLEPEAGNAVRDLRLVGVGVMSEPKRVHPGGDLGANVLGFTALDDEGGTKGAGGVELALDDVLAGVDGRSRAEVDGSGRIIPNGQRTVQEPVPGREVQLTLDRDLQWYAQDVLSQAVEEAAAESGTAVVMDIDGQVLALASVPTFDADDPGAAPAEVRGNRAVTDIFEPGSIGKVVTVAAGLESGAVTPDTVLTVPDRYRMSNKVFKDSHDHPTERMTVTGVLVESSNVGTIQIAEQAGADRVHEMLGRFGLGEHSGLGLPGESRGLVPDPSQWSGPTLGALAIGQSYSVNAVQIASVYATIANDGVRVTPTVVKGTADDETGEVLSVAAPEQRRIISTEHAAQLRGMLEGVTGEGGTAQVAAIEGYRVAGKTGTAQRVVDGRYNGYTASFVGFAPADDPRLVVAVSVQAPTNGYYGGVIAGPVFREVMGYALSNQQVPPTGTPAPRLRMRESDPR
jgi:cell division protein FtsI (penicillin-binding protein 3)